MKVVPRSVGLPLQHEPEDLGNPLAALGVYAPIVRGSNADFRQRDLLVHTLLDSADLHDVWVFDLPGGSPQLTLRDIPGLPPAAEARGASWIVRGLFGLRRWIGRLFHWDTQSAVRDPSCYAARLNDPERAQSLTPPGAAGPGPFRFVYEFERESLLEVHNATVHAFLSTSLEVIPGGYRVWLAIYVRPVSRWTDWYMALIDPFRRLIIYPALIRRVQREWKRLEWRR